jgi:hypothetical protein
MTVDVQRMSDLLIDAIVFSVYSVRGVEHTGLRRQASQTIRLPRRALARMSRRYSS